MTRRPVLLGAAVCVLLLQSGAQAAQPDRPPAMHLVARSSLPPGESGTYLPAGQAQYELDGKPSDFGPHVDDQSTYWQDVTKPASFATPTGTPVSPLAGVRIYRDSAGVPQVYGDSAYDTWYGDGYAAATDRLFEADAVRRTAEGTLAELTGPTQVPKDLAERTVFYTPAELDAMMARLSPAAKTALEGYTAGMEQRITDVRADPTQLPVEYALLSSLPADWTVEDTLAIGVYVTRSVASQGGGEFDNVAFLKELEEQYGTARGRAVFDDLLDEEDPKAAVTISGRSFSNVPPADRSAAAQHAAFERAADYADTLPAALASGPGTGASAVPPAVSPTLPTAVTEQLAQASAGLEHFAATIHGGSFAFAIAGSRTKNGHALLVSEPQLDYSYPGLLWESEVHGGGYDARGVNVPGIPTIGIGWNADVAWGLTTGYSKTIDSFVETTRTGPEGPQYLHDGTWVDETCRTETISYRTAAMGVPAGPALSSESAQVCRTVHGPVVATSGSLARSVDYAMWGHEIETIEGILDWDAAKDLSGIAAGVKKVTWNENITAADSHGNIGYWHPGRYLRRAPGQDQRFPSRGDGSADPTGVLTYDEMPHVIDPPEGYLANWNTKPAHGWLDGDLAGTPVSPGGGPTTTRPGGPSNRVVAIQRVLASRTDFTAADLTPIETRIGQTDFRLPGYLPLLHSVPAETPAEQAALSLLAHWDGRAYAPGAGSSPPGTPAGSVTDGPAATLFGALVPQLQQQVFSALPADLVARLAAHPAEGHQYDVTPLDNLVQRVLRPGYSGLRPALNYTGGRSAPVVVKAALDAAIASLSKTYGAAPSTWRRPHAVSHLTSLTDTVGPTGVTQPFEDRGSWVQLIAFTTGTPYGTAPRPTRPPARPTPLLPTTGPGAVLPLLAFVLLGVVLLRSRRPGRRPSR